ncbi:alkaline phosphatase [Aliikangiella coralliicola]|uniref:Alkaline phosphatase n=1 Tax=Aliikangiella coralliicola TaxID=2592383 RepID=A0A545U7H0_9GAMM|nr:alkaline phosphatase [Aliikangiella coralliicola]TQV85415.1 alkaline phosphatase [Aliikangiella coralliicola]
MKLLSFSLVVILSACDSAPVTIEPPANSPTNSSPKPKNIILLVGDGMGPAHIKAYRMFKDNPETAEEEKLVFDDYLVGSLSTNSYDSKENVTDSAASATAYATGKRTVNGALSIDKNGNHYKTVLEQAKNIGLSTGLVATSEIVHATPAAFASHQIDREQKNNIADQYFDNQKDGSPMVDVMLGGGLNYFVRKDRNLLSEFIQAGYTVVDSKKELLKADSEKLIGLFAKEGLPKMWDRDSHTPSLAEMTQVAIEQLSKNPKGFFLVVEGSQIDWAAHENDIVGVISEMADFEAAMKTAVDFAKADGNTLVVATADHETGGLSIGSRWTGEDRYHWDVEVIRSFKYTPAKITTEAQRSGNLVAEFHKATSLKLNEAEKQLLRESNLKSWDKTRRLVSEVISKRSYTGWTTYGHTGVDVFLYALGPGSESFRGHLDNTIVGQNIFKLLEQKQLSLAE